MFKDQFTMKIQLGGICWYIFCFFSDHPRFGRIPALKTIKPVNEGDELFSHYKVSSYFMSSMKLYKYLFKSFSHNFLQIMYDVFVFVMFPKLWAKPQLLAFQKVLLLRRRLANSFELRISLNEVLRTRWGYENVLSKRRRRRVRSVRLLRSP